MYKRKGYSNETLNLRMAASVIYPEQLKLLQTLPLSKRAVDEFPY